MFILVLSNDGIKRVMKWLITSSYVFDALNFLGENVNLDVESAYIF